MAELDRAILNHNWELVKSLSERYNSLADRQFNKEVDSFILFNPPSKKYLMTNYITPSARLIIHYYKRKKLDRLAVGRMFDINVNDGEIWSDMSLSDDDKTQLLKYNRLPYLDLSSNVDLGELSDRCVSYAETRGGSVNIYPVINVKDPRLMMKHGFFPVIDDNFRLDDLIEMSEREYAFWHNNRLFSQTPSIYRVLRWCYSTLYKHIQNGISKCISGPLLYLAPNMLYRGSKRPINNMLMYRNPLSLVINEEIKKEWNLIPVTRYSEGMSRGLYYESQDCCYCGTFYYNEPESTTFLAYKTSLVAFNKVDAYEKLGGNATGLVDPSVMEYIRMHIDGVIPPDFVMTADEIVALEESMGKLGLLAIKTREDVTYNGAMYVGHNFIYAAEDDLDQPLCELAKQRGYDVVILTNMVGSHQIVTEVMDTRDRVDSYRSLVYSQ